MRTSQKHVANNSAVLTKTQLLDKVSKHLPIKNGALETDRAFGVMPMRALPADYKSAVPAQPRAAREEGGIVALARGLWSRTNKTHIAKIIAIIVVAFAVAEIDEPGAFTIDSIRRGRPKPA